jgi:hypothetical protein
MQSQGKAVKEPSNVVQFWVYVPWGGGHVPSLNGMYGKDVHYRVFEFKLSNMHHLQCKNINAKKSKSRETFNLVQSCATMGKIHKQEKGRKKQK